MAFKTNPSQQLSINDSFINLTPRVQKFIQESWAYDFAKIVFPAIDEERFSVLYSGNDESRPNTPINVIVGALMLKEHNQMNDDEIMGSIYCDVRFQFALHTTSYEEQPVSDRTFSRFRERLYNYKMETGIDLLGPEMKRLADHFADYMKIDKSISRMDSLMIESRCKSMTRLEIVHKCVSNMIRLMHRLGLDDQIPSDMIHYLDDDDRNKVIYHARGDESKTRLATAISDAGRLRDILADDIWQDYSEYQLLIRVIREQAMLDEEDNLAARDASEISTNSLQNPSDPDATYREKAGKKHKGYVGNVVETLGENGNSIITEFQYEQNTYSDAQFMADYLERQEAAPDGETRIAITDGAYASCENDKLAAEKNIEIVSTSLTGRIPDELFSKFELSDDETKVIRCPAGKEPVKQTMYKTGVIRVQFRKSDCENCPHKDICKGKPQRKTYALHLSPKTVKRAQYLEKLSNDDKYRMLTRKRNGVEGVMSVLRRKYHIDDIPVTGYERSKVFAQFKVSAYNLGKLFKHCQRSRAFNAPLLAQA